MVNVDFLTIEYDNKVPVAFIEYKYLTADIQSSKHPSYQAIRWICDRTDLPFIAVRWSKTNGQWNFKAIPIFCADKILQEETSMNEIKYATFLYNIRGRKIPDEIIQKILNGSNQNHTPSP